MKNTENMCIVVHSHFSSRKTNAQMATATIRAVIANGRKTET